MTKTKQVAMNLYKISINKTTTQKSSEEIFQCTQYKHENTLISDYTTVLYMVKKYYIILGRANATAAHPRYKLH
jgi:hypothetical protein